MGVEKKPKVEILGMGPDNSTLVFNQLIAIGRHQIAKQQPVLNQLCHSDRSIQSKITQGTIDELSAQPSSAGGSRPVKQIEAKSSPQSLLRQDTHSTRSIESDDESDIDEFLDYARAVIAEKISDYDVASFRDFESKLSRSIRSHFRDNEDDGDSLNSASSYSGYSADEMPSHQSATNSLVASERSSCRQNGQGIARKKTWAEHTGDCKKGQDEVSIKTEDAWDNTEQTVDDLAFVLAIENHKGGLLSHQLSPGKIPSLNPSKHDLLHRHDTEVKKLVSEDNDSELTQSTALQGFKSIAGAQDDRYDMSQGASPSRSHDGRGPMFDAPSSPAPDAQDEPPSDEEYIVSEDTVRTAPSFQNRLRTGHENENKCHVVNDKLFYARSSPTLSMDASKNTTSLSGEENDRLGRNALSSPNAKTILDVDDNDIMDSRWGAMPASYDDDSALVARRYEQISRYLTGESFDRQMSLSIDDSAERRALPDLSLSKSVYESVVRSTPSDEMLSVSFDDAASKSMSIDDVIEQMSAAFSAISVDSGSQNITSPHVELGTIGEDPQQVTKGWDLDEMVENFLTGKIERLTEKLNAEKELHEKGQTLNGTHRHVSNPDEIISSLPLNTNLSSTSTNEKMQSDGHYCTSNHLEPSLHDLSGDSGFVVSPRELNEPAVCLSVEMPVQRIQQKLSFDEELQLKGRDLIRRIREKQEARIVSDLKGRVFDPSDDQMDLVRRWKDPLPSPQKSELTLLSPESQSNERSRVVDHSDGLKDSLSSPRKSGLALLSAKSLSSARSEVKTDHHHDDEDEHEHELVSFLTRQSCAPRSSPTMSKPGRTELKRRNVVLDMASLGSSKNRTFDSLHEPVNERYEDRQEEYQQSKRTSSAAPEVIFIKEGTGYNDSDKLKRSRPDSHHDFEPSIPCPLKSPTKKFCVNISCVDNSSPPPMLQSTPDSSNRPRGTDNSFLASELCSGYPNHSPPSPESPIGEFSMCMLKEASERNFELCENSIVSTGSSSNNREDRRGKVASPYSQSPDSSHRIEAKTSSYAPPLIKVNDSLDDIILRHRGEKSDIKQGQELSPTSVFDFFEPTKDPFLPTSPSSSQVLLDPILQFSSSNLAFVDDQEGDPLFLDDDEDIWASNSIVGSDNDLPVNSLFESDYCPPGVGKKAYREYGMLSPTRFEI
jgi:hypothetical protein